MSIQFLKSKLIVLVFHLILKSIYYYLQILLSITDTNKQEYVLFIKYNSRIIYNIIQSNYNLNITLSNIPNNIYNIIISI